MVNELKAICDLLEGYSEDKRFEVLYAVLNSNGEWVLKIKRITPPGETTQEVAENADQ